MIKKIKNKYKKKRELQNLPSAFDNAVISWIAPEYIQYKKGKIWKVLAVAVVLAAVTIGVLYNAWTFSIAILAFAVVYYIINREKPKEVEVVVSDIGVKVGKRRYPYSRIKAFWILYEPPFTKTLNIRVKGDFLLDIPIQLNHQNPGTIREFLMEKIPEMEGRTESLSDIFTRLFKI